MKVDYRSIKKRTRCTEEQAKYLAENIRKYPKVKDIIMSHIDKMNLENCEDIEMRPLYGYMDNSVNICGYRRDRYHLVLHKYGFDNLFPNDIFYEVI